MNAYKSRSQVGPALWASVPSLQEKAHLLALCGRISTGGIWIRWVTAEPCNTIHQLCLLTAVLPWAWHSRLFSECINKHTHGTLGREYSHIWSWLWGFLLASWVLGSSHRSFPRLSFLSSSMGIIIVLSSQGSQSLEVSARWEMLTAHIHMYAKQASSMFVPLKMPHC